MGQGKRKRSWRTTTTASSAGPAPAGLACARRRASMSPRRYLPRKVLSPTRPATSVSPALCAHRPRAGKGIAIGCPRGAARRRSVVIATGDLERSISDVRKASPATARPSWFPWWRPALRGVLRVRGRGRPRRPGRRPRWTSTMPPADGVVAEDANRRYHLGNPTTLFILLLGYGGTRGRREIARRVARSCCARLRAEAKFLALKAPILGQDRVRRKGGAGTSGTPDPSPGELLARRQLPFPSSTRAMGAWYCQRPHALQTSREVARRP
jgi:hypothetical protein